jgi:hypothetical protein
MLVILEVPSGTRQVTGSLRYEADIDSLFSWLGIQRAVTDAYRLSWKLERAEPLSAIPWKSDDIANRMIH